MRNNIMEIPVSVMSLKKLTNFLLLSDTPEDTCTCQNHGNLFLKLESMGHSYDNSFWGEVLRDTSKNSNC